MTLLASGEDKRGMRTKPGGEDAAATCVKLGLVSGAFVSPQAFRSEGLRLETHETLLALWTSEGELRLSLLGLPGVPTSLRDPFLYLGPITPHCSPWTYTMKRVSSVALQHQRQTIEFGGGDWRRFSVNKTGVSALFHSLSDTPLDAYLIT